MPDSICERCGVAAPTRRAVPWDANAALWCEQCIFALPAYWCEPCGASVSVIEETFHGCHNDTLEAQLHHLLSALRDEVDRIGVTLTPESVFFTARAVFGATYNSHNSEGVN